MSGVHRIKVDEKEQICITTHVRGGLAVTNLFPDVTLWSLPENYVRPYAHCEYGNGFLIFDRIGRSKEVWRLASDFTPDEVPPLSPPDYDQMRVAAFAARRHQQTTRGHFRPWALIVFPEVTLAYRFVYPTLLCAGESRAFLYDVRTGALVQTIEDIVADDDDVCYVELSERHVFVCATGEVRVFSRTDGARVLIIPSLFSVERMLLAQELTRTIDADVIPIDLVPLDPFDSGLGVPGQFFAGACIPGISTFLFRR